MAPPRQAPQHHIPAAEVQDREPPQAQRVEGRVDRLAVHPQRGRAASLVETAVGEVHIGQADEGLERCPSVDPVAQLAEGLERTGIVLASCLITKALENDGPAALEAMPSIGKTHVPP